MQKACVNGWCKQEFQVTDEDMAMLAKFEIDVPPDQCPNCRHEQRRMFTPTLKLHRRTSSMSGEPMLSIFHERCSFPVYSIQEWWSDRWDALSSGRPFDFDRPFFEQFKELSSVVPQMANDSSDTENCEYSYSCGHAKNVYYSRTVHRSNDVFYSQHITGYNQSLCDCLLCQRSSFLYECVRCFNCSHCTFLIQGFDCGDCHYSTDLIGCTDCLFCNNLRNKTHHVDNRPVSKEEYARIKKETFDGTATAMDRNRRRFQDVYARTVWKNLRHTGSENCVGDNLTNCSNCYHCFNCVNAVDVRYCCRLTPSEKCITSMDLTSGGIGELLYNSIGLGGGNYYLRMCMHCRECSNLTYCWQCHACKDCFGCVSLRNKRHCIFNTQYSPEEYKELSSRLVAHMKQTGEWGRFCPISVSPFAFNESGNNEENPTSKERILERGWPWYDEEEPTLSSPAAPWPEDISATPDSAVNDVFACAVTGKRYKIVQRELEFYRALGLPLPHEHPDVRMSRRRALQTPYALVTRPCMKCGKDMQTSYPPNRPEIVYCEECYLKEVY